MALSLLFAASALAQPAGSDWEAGLSLYRAKDYARACPLLRKAAEAAGPQGEPWADLGLCELKRGRKAESIRASQLAVRHGDEKTRKAAYFNLGLAGVSLAPKDVKNSRACVPLTLPNELECKQRFVVCGQTHDWYGYAYFEERTSELLILPCDGGDCPTQIPADPDCAGPSSEKCSMARIELSSERVHRGMGSTPAWSCTESSAVESRAMACAQKKGANEAACMKTACDEARRWQRAEESSRAEWTELQEELESWDSLHECKTCYEGRTQTECTLVSLNPCTGRAGAVCREQRSARDTRIGQDSVWPAKTFAQEFTFRLAPLPGD
ncbi:hypothetical protein NVS55_29445 [Myxococcus stipitatus]|uniref:tetratricopeptide repeat protein n=1 Tax=Myxococcus stipitatus TaxID=83455 RepID=UPI00314535B6